MDTILIISSIALWVILLFNLLITFALIRRINSLPEAPNLSKTEILKVGTQAPDFSVQSLDGTEITQDFYKNKVVAMVFVSSGCGPCKEYMPKFQELYPKALQAGIELVVINLDNLDITRNFASEMKFFAPIFAAPPSENSLVHTYKVPGTPSFYLIDAQGVIRSGGFLQREWSEMIAQWNT